VSSLPASLALPVSRQARYPTGLAPGKGDLAVHCLSKKGILDARSVRSVDRPLVLWQNTRENVITQTF